MKSQKYKKNALLLIVFAIGLCEAQINITDRAGTDVSSSSSVTSDNIHITLTSPSSYTTQEYQYHEGNNEPSTWGSSYDFDEDLYFYKKSDTDQWIKITINDATTTTTKIIELVKGTISEALDDDISPADYVAGMGTGFIVEGDNYASVSEAGIRKACYDMKKAGINHVRVHIGRQNKTKDGANVPSSATDDAYFVNLDLWATYMLRNGLYLHIGNKSNSVIELTLDEDDPTYLGLYAAEHVAWWKKVAERYQYASHRFAYHMFLEAGANPLFNSGNETELNQLYTDITEEVRLKNNKRNLIYTPPGINSMLRIGDLTFPYADQNTGDGITTGSGNYWFSDWHKGMAGGGWHPGTYDEQVSLAKAWMTANNKPLLISAVNADDRTPYPTATRVAELEQLFIDIRGGAFDMSITFLTIKKYYEYDIGWIEDYDQRARMEAINEDNYCDENDRDGDLLSNDYETGTSGTDPDLMDTDGDDISDFAEDLIAELDPNDPSDGTPLGSLSIAADYDGDGISNVEELALATFNSGSQTITHNLDFRDPTDSETAYVDNISNVWESILNLEIGSNKTYFLGNYENDNAFDHDGDGTNTVTEVGNHTWPSILYGGSGDKDRDEGLVGTGDLVPYVNATGHIVMYNFDENEFSSNGMIANLANQGGPNKGELTGACLQGQSVLYLNGTTNVKIENTNFLTLNNRTVHFHFQATDVTTEQILYTEGDSDNGMSIVISTGEIIATLWKTDGTLIEKTLKGSIAVDNWYSVTTTFDGANTDFRFALYKANRPLVRTHITTTFGSATYAGTATVSLGDVVDGTSTRVYRTGDSNTTLISTNGFDGYLDDFQIYNRVLSETEISLLSRGDIWPLKDISFTDADGDEIPDPKDDDDDNDTYADNEDAFPNDINEWLDTDGDGIGDNADTDDDGDGILDASDTDDDNDGVTDADEVTNGTDPLNPDSDGDLLNDGAEITATTDANDPDSDDDGIPDGVEVTNGYNPLSAIDGEEQDPHATSVGLVLYYKLDDQGSLVTDDSESLNIHHGTKGGIEGTSEWISDGKVGSAFHPSTGQIAVPTSFGTEFSTGNLTISLWAKTLDENQSNIVLEAENSDEKTVISIEIAKKGTPRQIAFRAGANTSSSNILKVDIVDDTTSDDWHHYVFMKDITSEELYIYKDGVLLGTATNKSLMLDGITKIVIGSLIRNVNHYHGYIDDLRIYNKVLSIERINSLAAGFFQVEIPRIKDCNDDFDGTAYIDNCDTCVEGNTGNIDCSVLGVDDFDNEFGFTYYPNPFSNQISLQFKKIDDYQINLYNTLGVKLFSKQIHSDKEELTLNNLPIGLYFLSLSGNNNTFTIKIIKNTNK